MCCVVVGVPIAHGLSSWRYIVQVLFPCWRCCSCVGLCAVPVVDHVLFLCCVCDVSVLFLCCFCVVSVLFLCCAIVVLCSVLCRCRVLRQLCFLVDCLLFG